MKFHLLILEESLKIYVNFIKFLQIEVKWVIVNRKKHVVLRNEFWKVEFPSYEHVCNNCHCSRTKIGKNSA